MATGFSIETLKFPLDYPFQSSIFSDDRLVVPGPPSQLDLSMVPTWFAVPRTQWLVPLTAAAALMTVIIMLSSTLQPSASSLQQVQVVLE